MTPAVSGAPGPEPTPAETAAGRPARNVIEVRDLVKRFGSRTVVDRVSMTVAEGEIVGFLGPNGSGKTTTIRMMCGLLTPDEGEGRVLGHDLLSEPLKIKREVGYMTQRFSFYEDLTIGENLEFVARLYQLSPVGEHVARALEQLGLAARRNQLAGTLSGGWKQRLALAACMIHEPDLLMLDEPTAGVDPEARRAFWNEIHELAARGVTVLVTTHYMDEVERCHEIAYLSEGRIVARGTPKTVARTSGLKAVSIHGPDLMALAPRLRMLPGITSVAALGAELVVSSADADALTAAVASLEDGRYRMTEVDPTFEDVFVELTRRVGTGDINHGEAAA